MDLPHQVSNTVYFRFLFCDKASCFCTSVKHSFFYFLFWGVDGVGVGQRIICWTHLYI